MTPKQSSEAEPGSFFFASSSCLSRVRKNHLSLLDPCFSSVLWQSESPGVGGTEVLVLTGTLSGIQECQSYSSVASVGEYKPNTWHFLQKAESGGC